MLRSTFLLISIPPMLLLGAAFAQPSGGASTQAVVAFMNILDHEAVLEREPTLGSDTDALAMSLLDHLDDEEILAPQVSEFMRASIPGATVDRGGFVHFLVDFLNHTEALDTYDVPELEARLASMYCGLEIPLGSKPDGATDPVLDSRDVSAVVQEFTERLDCIVPKLRDSYGEPVE